MDQLQEQYSKLEYVTKGASKLLVDYRPGNICKQKDMAMLEATNVTLLSQVANFKVELAIKNKEIHQLQVQSKEGLDRIWEFIGNLGDVVNKAYLFDNEVKTEGQLSAPKIITILVNFGCKMEATLIERRKLVSGSQSKPSRVPLPSLKATPQKSRPIVELKTLLLQRPMKELVVEIAKIEVLVALALAKTKMTKRELETPKTTSSEPSLQRSTRKKTKEPSPELEEEETESLEEVESSGQEPESEEEAKPTTPPPEKKKKTKTWASEQKKPASAFKTLVSQKRPIKTPKKGESSQKKLKRK